MGIQCIIDHAGLNRHLQVLFIDIEDLFEPIHRQYDAPVHRNGIPLQAGPTAPGHHRNVVIIGVPHHARDLFGVAWPNDRVGQAG